LFGSKIDVTDTHMDISMPTIASDELKALSLVPEWDSEWVIGAVLDRDRRLDFSV